MGKRHGFYDTVNTMHDVITTANLFPDTTKFMFVGVRNNKTVNKSDVERHMQIEYVHSVVVYQKHLTPLGEMINFLAKARKLSVLPVSLNIFDIRQHYILISY